MKRFAALALTVGALGVSGAVIAPAAFAATSGSACVTYSININDQGQSGTECLPALPAPSLP
ncbi:MAG TPA: hypothetical protein VFJ21_07840 [Mycobacteriales bacterium]|jgi:hypothetical protein|nr:hypothetical protein [Mycobacteriales bacterium]